MSLDVLVPVDGSPLSDHAVDHALSQFPDADITVLTVINPVESVYVSELQGPFGGEQWYEQMKEWADAVQDDARKSAAEHDREIETATTVGKPAREIVEYVESHGVDHVVMGSHGRSGLEHLLLGSVAEAVMRQSPVPVTILR